MSFSSLTNQSYKKTWLSVINFSYTPLTAGSDLVTVDVSGTNYVRIYVPEMYSVTAIVQQEVLSEATSMTEVFSYPTDITEFYRLDEYIYFDEFLAATYVALKIDLTLRITDSNDINYYSTPSNTASAKAKFNGLMKGNISIDKGSASSLHGLVTSSISALSIAMTSDIKWLITKEIQLYKADVKMYLMIQELKEARLMFVGLIGSARFSVDEMNFTVIEWTEKLNVNADFGAPKEYWYNYADGTLRTSLYPSDLSKKSSFVVGRQSYAELDYLYSTVKSIDTYNGITTESDEIYCIDYDSDPASGNRNWGFFLTWSSYGSLFSTDSTATYTISGFDKRVAVADNRIYANGDIIKVVISAVTYYDRVILVSTANNTRLHVLGGLDGTIPYPASPTTFSVDIQEIDVAIENSDGYLQQISPAYYSFTGGTASSLNSIPICAFGVNFAGTLEAAYTTLFGTDPILTPDSFNVYARMRTSSSYYSASSVLTRFFQANSFTMNSAAITTFDTAVAGLRYCFQYQAGVTYKQIIEKLLLSAYSLAYINDSGEIVLRALYDVRTSAYTLYDHDISSDISANYDGDGRTYEIYYVNDHLVDYSYQINQKFGSPTFTYETNEKYLLESTTDAAEFAHYAENIDTISLYISSILSKRFTTYTFSVGNIGLNFEIGDNFTYKGKLLSPIESSRLLTILSLSFSKDSVTVTAADLYGNSGEDGV